MMSLDSLLAIRSSYFRKCAYDEINYLQIFQNYCRRDNFFTVHLRRICMHDKLVTNFLSVDVALFYV